MANQPPEDSTLRKVLTDVIQGYSSLEHKGELAFVKHFGSKEQQELEVHYENTYKKAQDYGLPTKKEALQFIKDEGLWSDEEENELNSNKSYLKNLKDTKKNLVIPSQIVGIKKDIEEVEEKIFTAKSKRNSLISETCERYAQNKSNDYSIYISFYKDEKCTEKLFNDNEFDELTKQEISEWFSAYLNVTDHLSINNIKYLSISNIFSMYYNLLGANNLYKMIEKPVYDFSFYQLNLLNYAKVLHSIIENHEKIPEHIKKDPDELLNYAESASKNKNMVNKSRDRQGYSVVGASNEDMKQMGVQDEASVSLHDLAKKGGSLTIKDFQKFS